MKKGSIRKTSLAGLAGIIMVMSIFGFAYGYGSYYTQFNTMYGGAGAMMNSCGVCHIDPAGGGPRTLYGEDVFTQLSAGAAIAAALTAVEPHDPDGDTYTNIQEITARTNPSDPASHPTAPPPPPVTPPPVTPPPVTPPPVTPPPVTPPPVTPPPVTPPPVTPPVTPPPPPATGALLNILWQNQTTGTLSAWLMNGTSLTSLATVTPGVVSDCNWKIVGMGDFNNDGQPDILWQNQTTGSLSVWLMNGTSLASLATVTPGGVSDTNWKIVGTGDFNGDGKPDILWQHQTTGSLSVWLMNGTSLASLATVTPGVVSDTNWKIVGINDFNGDGKPDILWQHHATGTLSAWLMNGTSLTSLATVNPGVVSDTNWKIVGATPPTVASSGGTGTGTGGTGTGGTATGSTGTGSTATGSTGTGGTSGGDTDDTRDTRHHHDD